jgi:hypothetical protein
MNEPQPAPPDACETIVSRAAVIAKIEEHLAGKLSAAALANWAFDRFYALELGQEQFETEAEPVIANALDTLMFDDDPHFRLDLEELRALIAQLG